MWQSPGPALAVSAMPMCIGSGTSTAPLASWPKASSTEATSAAEGLSPACTWSYAYNLGGGSPDAASELAADGAVRESVSHATWPMAASCAPVPVRSTTMMPSRRLRPSRVPLTTSPSSAYTSSSRIAPASIADRSSPTRAHCRTRSHTTLASLSTSAGISFLVGWSEPEAMMVACGLSHERSSTISAPVVCVNTTSAWFTAASAEAHAVKGYPSSASISAQKAATFSASRL
mmetsp:Transcript_25308/g.83142  ORF Transcript_25308/g.83142 Transcript_25308/m.83142 type:complete len:232 (+) Transcript_25308:108-803(+)